MIEDGLSCQFELLLLQGYFLVKQLAQFEVVCTFGELPIIFVVDVNLNVVFAVVQVLTQISQHLGRLLQEEHPQDDCVLAIEFESDGHRFEELHQQLAHRPLVQDLHRYFRDGLAAGRIRH